MNTPLELIRIVELAGGRLTIEGGLLAIAPRSAGEPSIAELRKHRDEILLLLRERMWGSFQLWLNFATLRNDRWFTNFASLHHSFCVWQSERGDTLPITSDFNRMLDQADFLVGDIDGTELVSGLAFKSDLAAHQQFEMPASTEMPTKPMPAKRASRGRAQ